MNGHRRKMRAWHSPTIQINLSEPPSPRAVENMASFDRLPHDWQLLCRDHGLTNGEELISKGIQPDDVRDYIAKRGYQ